MFLTIMRQLEHIDQAKESILYEFKQFFKFGTLILPV